MANLHSMLEEASILTNYDFDVDPIPVEINASIEHSTTLHRVYKQQNSIPLPAMSGCLSIPNTVPSFLTTAYPFPFIMDQHILSYPEHSRNGSETCDKPKRPLSAYNLFFQHEREKIITNSPDMTFEESMYRINSAPKPKKRKHRKSHGMISFAQLARTIADKWKTLDRDQKNLFEVATNNAKASYEVKLNEWTRAQEIIVKDDGIKSSIALARVEQGLDGVARLTHQKPEVGLTQPRQSHDDFYIITPMQRQPAQCSRISISLQDSLSSLLSHANDLGSQYHPTFPGSRSNPDDLQACLEMTQYTIDMARASLNLPLFAGLGKQQTSGSCTGNVTDLCHTTNFGPNDFCNVLPTNRSDECSALFHHCESENHFYEGLQQHPQTKTQEDAMNLPPFFMF